MCQKLDTEFCNFEKVRNFDTMQCDLVIGILAYYTLNYFFIKHYETMRNM